MIARSLTIFLCLGAALAYKPFEGVDPNSLQCDSEGLVFLLLPHFEECDKFYMCVHGEEKEFQCPAGTIFDFELQGCDWSWATTCQLRGSDLEGSGYGEEFLSEDSIKTADAQLGHFDLNAEEVPKVERLQNFNAVMNCANAESASRHLPYRGDCQRFWRCENGAPQAAYCSDGLFFNERTQQCDFEANAKCVDQQVNELGGEFIEYN